MTIAITNILANLIKNLRVEDFRPKKLMALLLLYTKNSKTLEKA